MGEIRASYHRFKREGEPPPIVLTDDDVAILQHVYRHRFVRADDLYRLFPDRSPDKLSRRLVRLYRSGYLDRPIAQIDRYREGGSSALVYGLDTRGARHLKEECGVPVGVANWKARNRAYTRQNLDHTLAVSRFMIDLELECRAHSTVELIPFEEILAGAPEATRRSPRPGGWPVPVRWADEIVEVLLVPDAIFGLRRAMSDGRTLRTFVFLEIDRGTTTIVPSKHVRDRPAFLHRTSILRKLVTYTESHFLALHQAHLNIPIARVLMLTTSRARAEGLRKTAFREVLQTLWLPEGLFLFGEMKHDNPLSWYWTTTNGNLSSLVS